MQRQDNQREGKGGTNTRQNNKTSEKGRERAKVREGEKRGKVA
jgi:hypothetical protein